MFAAAAWAKTARAVQPALAPGIWLMRSHA